MSLSLAAVTAGTAVLVPSALLDASIAPDRAMSPTPATPVALVRATTGLTDHTDNTVWITLEQETAGLARNRWVNVVNLFPATPATLEDLESAVTTTPTVSADALAITAARRQGAMAEKRERDAAIVEALLQAVEDGVVEEESLEGLAERLSVEMPAATFTVEVEVIVRRTLTVTANNAEGRHALRSGDTSFVEQSIAWNGDAFDTTDGDLTIDHEDGTDEEVTVTDIQQD